VTSRARVDPNGRAVTSEQLRVRWFIGKIHRYSRGLVVTHAGENDRAHERVIASRQSWRYLTDEVRVR
jgi:hypothetical protein